MTTRRKLIREIEAALRAVAVPADAEPMRAYMKSEMPYLGVKKPARTAALKAVFAAHLPLREADLWDTALALWKGASHRELRYAATDLIRHRTHRAHVHSGHLDAAEVMIVSGAWWDHVDEIAAHVVGEMLRKDPGMKKAMRAWSTDDDLWKRRTSILCQLRFKDALDQALLRDCMAPSLDAKEFFLRKAIGWALRDHARVDPDWVRAYVKEHEDRLSGLSRREALKHL